MYVLFVLDGGSERCPPSAKFDLTRRCHGVFCKFENPRKKAADARAAVAAARASLAARYGSLQGAVRALQKHEGRRTKQTTESLYVRLARHARALPLPTRASARLRTAAAGE